MRSFTAPGPRGGRVWDLPFVGGTQFWPFSVRDRIAGDGVGEKADRRMGVI